jgi:hypothetical protein
MTDVAKARLALAQHFPGVWPSVDVGLATCATLLLADNMNPTALIYVGGPSTGKTPSPTCLKARP